MTNQIESDRRLLKYKTYDEYLDSLVTPMDLAYLRSTVTARAIAELGYKSCGDTLSCEQFTKRRAAVMEYMNPSRKPYQLCSEHLPLDDPILEELALRERANRVGLLATIIFVRHYTRVGHEISGYIDYADRLTSEDWLSFFEGKKRLWPRLTDLGYYHWRTGMSSCNSSLNYRAIVDPIKGLLFQNRNDRKVITVDPNLPTAGSNTSRVRIYTPKYEHVVLYDHVVRRKS